MACCVAGAAFAETSPQETIKWVDGKFTIVTPDDCHCLKDTNGAGAGAGAWLGPHWGLEMDALRIRLQSHDGGLKALETEIQLAVLYDPFGLGTNWKPYLRLGAGAVQVQWPFSLGPDTTTRLINHGGLGFQAWWGDHGFASLELRSALIDTRASRRETQSLLGVGYRWGALSAPAAPAGDTRPPVLIEAIIPPVAPTAALEPIAPAVVPPPVAQPPVPVAPLQEASAPVAEPEPTAAKPLLIVLDDATLHFANSKAILSPGGVAAIHQVADSLKGYPGVYEIIVSGHTSSSGSRAYNLALSRQRAEAVLAILVQAGLPASSMHSEGKGPDQPIADNGTALGQARNRRVEIGIKSVAVQVRHTETQVQGSVVPPI